MNFTESQREAITARGGSVLVSAGAGSGKTRVLTERLMEYIDPRLTDTEPEEINRFLVITFTRAAADELRGRISEAITKRLRQNPMNPHLRRQLLLCRTAQIGTIHSFCAKLLRENASQLGISQSFRILEEERSEHLRNLALEHVMETSYEEADENFLKLVDRVGAGKDDSRLCELLLTLHAALQSHARPDRWIESQIELLDHLPEDVADTEWGKELLSDVQDSVSFHRQNMEFALEEMESSDRICGAYKSSFSQTCDALATLEKMLQISWDKSRNCFPIPFPRISGIKNNPNPELAERLKQIRSSCKKAMEKAGTVFSAASAELMKELKDCAPEMKTLLQLTLNLEAEFREQKRRINALDFSDLEHYSVMLLTDDNGNPTETAKELSVHYLEIMVDEYQDVSRVQDQIFHALSRNGKNLFFVGDLKQSIYRFRLADPGIFTEKSRQYADGENDRGDRLIRLQENFRSREAVLDAVNSVFLRCMSEKLGDLHYDEKDCLIPGRKDTAAPEKPELLLIPRGETDYADEGLEARRVAEEIHRLMQKRITVRDESGERPLRYEDIAILLRSANSLGGIWRRELIAGGIPVAAGSGDDFFGSLEISTVYSMLALLDNPHRDVPLLTVLSSPCFGFTHDQLSMIRAARPNDDFFSALCASEERKAAEFLEKLNSLRDAVPDLDQVALVERVIDDLDLYAICSAMADGEQRIQHLMDLTAMAEAFAASGEKGLHRFVRWLQNMEKKGRVPESCSSGGNTVKIMSIHKSKGLEFPVVFYAGLGRSFNRSDIRSPVLVHPHLGLGPRWSDGKTEYPTVARRAIDRRLTREMLSEEMRLAYVAMTRAKDLLIMTACIKNAEDLVADAGELADYQKIPAELMSGAACPLQWIMPAAVNSDAIELRICDFTEIKKEETVEKTTKNLSPGSVLDQKLRENLNYVYPWIESETLPSKLTATGIKRTADPDADLLIKRERPLSFTIPDTLSPERKGTAVHTVMEQIAFEKTGSPDEIKEEIRRLLESEYLSGEEAESIDAGIIWRFFASPLGERVRTAKQSWREFRFSLLEEVSELFPEASVKDQILLQGIVDCFFMEKNALVLVDYKTDHVFAGNEIRQRAEQYRIQLETYAKALEKIFHLPVLEKHICFLLPGKTVLLQNGQKMGISDL